MVVVVVLQHAEDLHPPSLQCALVVAAILLLWCGGPDELLL